MRSRVQEPETFFLRKVVDLFLVDKIKSTDIQQSLNIEPLLLHIERSRVCWYGHVTRMSHKRTAKQLMDALPSSKRLRGRLRTRWRDYAKDRAWSRLGISTAELRYLQKMGMLVDPNLSCCLGNPKRTSGQ